MKIALRQDSGIAILDISGEVSPKEFTVLKAGISKLLRDGKNKIILNLNDAKTLDSDVIREVAIVDLFARELAGRIIISSTDPDLKTNVLNFSKPPVIPFLASVELALDFFKKMAPDAADSEESAEDLRKAIGAKDKELEAVRAQMKALDPGQITKLKGEKAELLAKCRAYEKQIETLLKSRRDPVDASGFLDKILTLEDTVKKLSPKKA